MKIGIIKEQEEQEFRVAASPETVKKFIALGAEILIETGAGEAAALSDTAYEEAGATLEKTASSILKKSDIILKVQSFNDKEITVAKKGVALVAMLNPLGNKDKIKTLADHQITAFAMELMPRITRAQSMDVLSSQSNLAGYKAVLDAVQHLGKAVPMMMTAAGTIQPANILVLGAGVAGLQAIATAKRLGAVVSAFDVRPAVKEQVESLGASFIEVASEETDNAETKGGYAKEMSKEYQQKQRQLIHDTAKTQDVIITTALIPGKSAPILITKAMVQDMKPGSVIVDLAALAGGNCEYTQPGKVIEKDGVTIIGHENVPSRVAHDASLLYAKNLLNFVSQLIDKESSKLKIDLKDEIIENTLVTHQGKIVHPLLKEASVKKGTAKARTSKAPPKKVTARKPHLKKKPTPKKPTRK